MKVAMASAQVVVGLVTRGPFLGQAWLIDIFLLWWYQVLFELLRVKRCSNLFRNFAHVVRVFYGSIWRKDQTIRVISIMTFQRRSIVANLGVCRKAVLLCYLICWDLGALIALHSNLTHLCIGFIFDSGPSAVLERVRLMLMRWFLL